MSGFKNCYWDFKKQKLYFKAQEDTEFKEVEFNNWCYIPDKTKKSKLTDIHKTPMERFDYKDRNSLIGLKGVCEGNLRPEVKYMHQLYDNEELHVDMSLWNICFFDIEVASGSKYYDETLIKVCEKKTNKTIDVSLIDFDMKFDHDKYFVYDIEVDKYLPYEDSCFVSYDFPSPEIAQWPINAITCYSTKTKQSYTWSTIRYTDDPKDLPNYTYCKSEVVLIREWIKWFSNNHFDIITGWNSLAYDIPYIMRRCEVLREKLDIKVEWEKQLSPLGMMPIAEKITDRKMENVELGTKYTIPGLYSLDYMKLYEVFGSHPPLSSYSLNYVANLELNDQKLEYSGAISETYKIDGNNFLKYNRKDVMIMVDLETKNKLFDLIIEYAFDCLVTLDKVEQKVPTTTGYILKFLHKTNRVLNDREDHHVDWWRNERCYIIKDKDGNDYFENTEWEPGAKRYKDYCKFRIFYDAYKEAQKVGKADYATIRSIVGQKRFEYWKTEDAFIEAWKAYKKDPHPFPEFQVKAGYCYDFPGRHDDCMSFDITSSYPHHIMEFHISPELKVVHPTKEQIESGEVIPTDVAELGFYNRDDGILPNVVKQVFAERKIYKNKEKECEKNGDKAGAHLYYNRQMTKKLIINSVYGVSLANSFALYDPDVARAICRCARVTLRDWLTKHLNEYYVSPYLLKDVIKEFSTVSIITEEKTYKYDFYEKITVLRGNDEMEIYAYEFNKDTDLLGIED